MAYTLMAYIAMAYVVMAYIGMAYIVMAYIATAYGVMAYIVMARIVDLEKESGARDAEARLETDRSAPADKVHDSAAVGIE